MEQTDFDFGAPERKVMPEHPRIALAWREGRVVRTCLEDPRVRPASFPSWQAALDVVCCPQNDHVSLRVRP